jgi:hypothetical protein
MRNSSGKELDPTDLRFLRNNTPRTSAMLAVARDNIRVLISTISPFPRLGAADDLYARAYKVGVLHARNKKIPGFFLLLS